MQSYIPRIYTDAALHDGAHITLSKEQAHYVFHVMRLKTGDCVLLFNGEDGEWKGDACDKKTIQLIKQTRVQTPPGQDVHLFFCPIKKERQRFLIEKAVELGVTQLHPIISENTQHRRINPDKIMAWIIEAAEQCERLDIPTLHPIATFTSLPLDPSFFVAMERFKDDTPTPLIAPDQPIKIIIGPEGGWSAQEIAHFQTRMVCALSLGPRILRAETAALAAIVHLTALS